MIIRHVCYSGPIKKPAMVKFGPGLNLIYGASNTGKSSVLDTIDFMLGREKALKELPEHVGYQTISLGLEFSKQDSITLFRSINGGDFKYCKGIHLLPSEDLEFEVLKEKTSTKKIKSVSEFVLEKIDLSQKKLKKNAKNETENLTLRTLIPLALITETDIQKERSPFHSGQVIKVTVEKSRMRLLLSGSDDSSLVSVKEKEQKQLSQASRIEILNEIIEEQKKKVVELIAEEMDLQELNAQKEKLVLKIKENEDLIKEKEGDYLESLNALKSVGIKLGDKNDRLTEINEMLARFDLLNQHYDSDKERLGGIMEAGSLITALSTPSCPLCGAEPDNQNLQHDCDGNTNIIVEAANEETIKITRLQIELTSTITKLTDEKLKLKQDILRIEKDLFKLKEQVNELSPDLSIKRVDYVELQNKKVELDKNIDDFTLLNSLMEKVDMIKKEKTSDNETNQPEQDTTKIPTSSLDDLAKCIQSLLKEWGLPNVERVHFDSTTNDLVLNGKNRTSNGKGHRSITHAAVTLGLMKYCEEKSLPLPGFAILDSPLLAYEEPENDEDDLTGTDVNKKFFSSLRMWESLQTIVFENKKSIPDEMKTGEQIVFFSKKHDQGRYGFFP